MRYSNIYNSVSTIYVYPNATNNFLQVISLSVLWAEQCTPPGGVLSRYSSDPYSDSGMNNGTPCSDTHPPRALCVAFWPPIKVANRRHTNHAVSYMCGLGLTPDYVAIALWRWHAANRKRRMECSLQVAPSCNSTIECLGVNKELDETTSLSLRSDLSQPLSA